MWMGGGERRCFFPPQVHLPCLTIRDNITDRWWERVMEGGEREEKVVKRSGQKIRLVNVKFCEVRRLSQKQIVRGQDC